MKPHVSVVMAARNYGRYIDESIRSVLTQSFHDWELLIVDDGSTDRTPQYVAAYRDPRIRFFRADRLGQSRAKNLAIDLSRGKFVAFLDADDVWVPTKLERQLPLFTPEVGVVYSLRTLIDEHSRPLPLKPNSPARGELRDHLFVQNCICFSSAIVRRTVIDQVGRFDDSIELSIDYDFWLRVSLVSQFDFVAEPLVRYRTGHANLSLNLDDRVQIACSVMQRAAIRGGLHRGTIAKGFASTCRTLAYVLRHTRPADSLAWSWRAFTWPHQRWQTIKGIIGTLLTHARQARTAVS